MGKVLDPERIIKHFYRDIDIDVVRERGLWTVRVADIVLSSLNDCELTKVFFGPESFEGLPKKIFPLPLWFWGLDAA